MKARASHPSHFPRRGCRLTSGERRRLRRGIDLQWPPPPEVEPCKALTSVLRTDDVYDLHRGTPLGEWHPDRLKLSRRPLNPKPISDFVDEEARQHIEQWQRYIVRSDTEMRELADSGAPLRPYWDPVLRDDPAAKIHFLRILHRSGLLAWRRGSRCRVGAFFVLKKDGESLRLVIDARAVNACHRRPPKSRLASASAVADLKLSEEALDFEGELDELEFGLSHDHDTEPTNVRGFSVDLCDGFYQFTNETMASWFGFGITMTAAEICSVFGVVDVAVLDEATGRLERLSDSTPLEACFGGLAMGWSWALYFCHNALCLRMTAAMRRLAWPAAMVGSVDHPPHISRQVPAAAPYVDNANVIALRQGPGTLLHRMVIVELEENGLEWHDEHFDEALFEFLGLALHGGTRVLCHTRKRTWRLFFALDDLCHRKGVYGDTLRVVLGHLIHLFGVRSELLAALEQVFYFVIGHIGQWAVFPQGVIAELVVARGLVFQAYADLARPVAAEVHCSDSSSLGFELSRTVAHPREVLEATRWRERQRFIETLEPLGEDAIAVDTLATADLVPLVSDDSDFGRWAALACPTATHAAKPQHYVARPRVKKLFNGFVPVLPASLLRPSRFLAVVTGAWRRPGVIHALESRVALMGLRDASRTPSLQDSILLSLGDNLSEILATDKGRSQDPVLNALLRIRAGLCVSSGIEWRRRHVETKRNPTDRGSRLADDGGLGPGEIRRRTQRHRESLEARSTAAAHRAFPPDSMLRADDVPIYIICH